MRETAVCDLDSQCAGAVGQEVEFIGDQDHWRTGTPHHATPAQRSTHTGGLARLIGPANDIVYVGNQAYDQRTTRSTPEQNKTQNTQQPSQQTQNTRENKKQAGMQGDKRQGAGRQTGMHSVAVEVASRHA